MVRSAAVCIVLSLGAAAWGASATLNAGPGGGLTAGGAWSSSSTTLFYDVNQVNGLWTYRYVLTVADDPAISNVELEVTPNLPQSALAFTLAPTEFGTIKANNGTQMPEDFYGAKWDLSGDPLVFEVTITTAAPPMWGDFNAKGGQISLRNTGFTLNDVDPDPSATGITDHILVPDTGSPPNGVIPEPLTLAGMGLGLGALGGVLRRRTRRPADGG